jgi:putative glycosyltransferase (TIGR04348 family)
MKIFMACPAPPRSRKGNRVTAVRWARILRSLGQRVIIGQMYDGSNCDLLIALHARRSHEAVARFHRLHPDKSIVVVLTGTDLYRDILTSRQAQQSLKIADRLVILQPEGRKELPPHLRHKVRVIYQSATPTPQRFVKNNRSFEVCVLGHLREEKDPFRAALAVQLLPENVPIRITHAGEAMSPNMEKQARVSMAADSRYRWIGEVPRWRARRILARSRLMILSSRMEGGANVISEAIVDGVPVLASRISGNLGMLGAAYPGYFPLEDTQALGRLLARAESDAVFYAGLKAWCDRLAPLFHPDRERSAWTGLLKELTIAGN